MKLRTAVALYSLLVGAMMAVMWTAFALMGEIPELDTRPTEIAFHLAAEFLTAFALVAGGIGLLKGRGWGYPVNLAALGMLAYTVVVSPGYYAESGDMAFVGMFAALMALTLAFIAISVYRREDITTPEGP